MARNQEDIGEFLVLPFSEVERVRKARNREAYELRHEGRKTKAGIPNRERRFIGWDGEGPRDTGYSLFGNSDGLEICHPHLSSIECFNLLLSSGRANPSVIHIIFGGNYDASNWVADLSWRHLSALKEFTITRWRDYEIEYVPRKWFTIRDTSDGFAVQVFDICSFFGTKYVAALEEFNIGTATEIALLTSQKARRAEFLWSEIEEIKPYMRLELKLLPELANSLRMTFLDAGFDVRSWHGPGALARMALKRHNVKQAMAIGPADVGTAAQHAFAGGRFEMFRAGHLTERIYNADIRSAYPGFARNLPNLAKGTWRAAREFEPGKFGIYRIDYSAPYEPFRPYPLFRRLNNGEICWPNRVSGWYHAPEAALVANDPNAKFIKAYIFEESDSADRPFAWIEEYFEKRQALKRAGSKAEFTFKLIINSVYGQLAQRTGWDKNKKLPPSYHQLEWAGYITSACRALVYKTALACGEKLISIDTDGIYAFAPIAVWAGTRLGEWELDEYDEGIFWQSGIYMLRRNGEWEKAKSRGIPKGSYDAEDLLRAMLSNGSLHLSKNVFTGFGLALNNQFNRINTWTKEPHEFEFGGQGKRYHNTNGCRNGTTCYRSGNSYIHGLVPTPTRENPYDPTDSAAHRLPWLVPDYVHKGQYIDEVLFGANGLDQDDAWMLDDFGIST